jgi:hypothetical protein
LERPEQCFNSYDLASIQIGARGGEKTDEIILGFFSLVTQLRNSAHENA